MLLPRWQRSIHNARDPGAIAGWDETPLSPLFPYIFMAVSVETLLFGMHAILFAICMRILLRRPQRRKVQYAMIFAVTVMFICSTADIALSWNVGINHANVVLLGNSAQLLELTYPKIILFHINSIIADTLLIIRCFVVWGRHKLILYVGGVVFAAISASLGIYSECATTLQAKALIVHYVIALTVFNVILTTATASRIYWVARQASKLMGRKLVTQHHFAVAIVVESGLLYTAAAIVALVLGQTNYVLLGTAISTRIIALMPILIIVQVAMKQSVQDVKTTVANLQEQETTHPFLRTTVLNESDAQVLTHNVANRSPQDNTVLPDQPINRPA